MKNINSVNVDKFKSIFVSINFLMPLSVENMSKNALLACVMKKSNKIYKSEKEINRKLAQMYCSSADILVEKFKEYVNLKVVFEYINTDKLSKEEIVEFLDNYMLNLDSDNICFGQDVVEREKQGLLERIEEEKDNKRKYALEQLNKMLYEGEAYSCPALGDKKIISAETPKSLKSHFEYIIKNAKVVVNVVGNLKNNEEVAQEIYSSIIQKLPGDNTINIEPSRESYLEGEYVKEKEEKQRISQSVIAIGAKLKNITGDDIYKVLVYNQVLGGNPASLMFQNVREKNSLAYFAKSMYNRQRQTISIFAGIEPKNYGKAKALMMEQFDILKNGEFSDEQFTASKDTVISSLKDIYDSKEELERMLFTNEMYFGRAVEINEMLEHVNKVNKQDVIDIANRIFVDSVFCLGGETHE